VGTNARGQRFPVPPLIGGTGTGPALDPPTRRLLSDDGNPVGMTENEAIAAVMLVFPGAELITA